jgi:ATP-dependent DNA helicase RecG
VSSPEDITANFPLTSIPGIGDHIASQFYHLGIHRAGDLLRHLPLRYEHELAEHTLSDARQAVEDGEQGHLTVRGFVAALRRQRGRSARIEATIEDDSATARLVWFNAGWIANKLLPGLEIMVTGKASLYQGHLQFSNPRFTLMTDEETETPERTAAMRPIYPGSEELASPRIERAVKHVLQPICERMEDSLPESYRKERNLIPLGQAYQWIHAPEDEEQALRARHRLAFDELLLMQLGVMMRRHQLRKRLQAPALRWDDELDARIRDRFPFPLTSAQSTVIREIAGDLSKSAPMNRLLQGDVGAGKTAVALYGMLAAVASGHQAALMAPTEILAEQHLGSIRGMLEKSDVTVELLTGNLSERVRKERLARIVAGEIDIVIGTHALLTKSVRFKSLALAVIDEQHRFGVAQRAALREKSKDQALVPHVLVMTATPIPRTLSLTLFGDLDVSTIDERLPGRTAPITRVVTQDQRPDVYGYLAQRLASGDQGYVVVPAIDESENGLADVHSHLDYLAKGPLTNCTIEAMHGRLDATERDSVMSRFRSGEIQCLVATVVIEVGVDVSNATMMVIEHAERFGLAQLHQLRGRVGRGLKKSVCALVGEPTTEEGQRRLEAIASTDDGFKIAELDLEIRGPGELFGSRQSGMPPLLVADLLRDGELLNQAREDAAAWIDRSPDLAEETEALLRRKLLLVYGDALGLGDVG